MKTIKLNLVQQHLNKLNVTSLKSKIKTPKLICTILLIVLHIAPVFAQDTVEGQIAEWSTSIRAILNAAVGIFSIGGGFLIFIQYMQGNEQAQKNFVRFIMGLAIFGLVALIANIFLPDAADIEIQD
ncbi:hypothetical protein [uncultured Aquimarina sp.]|uniref:hypothetical protein n=1 Tax=uncultured Aquimarina sp. TaxID=575652 RepID=UPI00262544C6|nr:hypothetical protein [uncultured Aquimarina sp.]